LLEKLRLKLVIKVSNHKELGGVGEWMKCGIWFLHELSHSPTLWLLAV
jgi:hypothetical protein